MLQHLSNHVFDGSLRHKMHLYTFDMIRFLENTACFVSYDSMWNLVLHFSCFNLTKLCFATQPCVLHSHSIKEIMTMVGENLTIKYEACVVLLEAYIQHMMETNMEYKEASCTYGKTCDYMDEYWKHIWKQRIIECLRILWKHIFQRIETKFCINLLLLYVFPLLDFWV